MTGLLAATLLAASAPLAHAAQQGDGDPDPSPGSVGATGPTLPLNDLEALLALTADQLSPMKTPVPLTGPPLTAVPRATCGAGSRPLRGVQGRVTASDVSSPQAARGWTCNTRAVGHLATPGGFRTWRYTDPSGHTCAFYDTSFTAPLTIASVAGGPSLGTAVVDVSNPSRPRQVDTLVSPGMLAPHESLNLNSKRGLLAAEVGNATTLPGTLDVYDVRSDCRHPRLLSQTPTATGHESGFSPDGRTFWVGGGAGYIYAFDLTDPRHPAQLWRGAYYSHGLNLSADGNTLYQTDPINGNLGLLDVSEIQARKAHPRVRDVSRVTWPTVSVPQNTIPFTSHGHRYLVEFDEFAFRFNPATVEDKVGGVRIINVDDPARPRLTSNLRLQVQSQAEHRAADGDPSALPPNQVVGYASHYCALPTADNPTVLACSELNSGLRLFDIRDPAHPRESGYFLAPPQANRVPGVLPGNLAFSQPAFDTARHQVLYTDAVSGLWTLGLSEKAWPR